VHPNNNNTAAASASIRSFHLSTSKTTNSAATATAQLLFSIVYGFFLGSVIVHIFDLQKQFSMGILLPHTISTSISLAFILEVISTFVLKLKATKNMKKNNSNIHVMSSNIDIDSRINVDYYPSFHPLDYKHQIIEKMKSISGNINGGPPVVSSSSSTTTVYSSFMDYYYQPILKWLAMETFQDLKRKDIIFQMMISSILTFLFSIFQIQQSQESGAQQQQQFLNSSSSSFLLVWLFVLKPFLNVFISTVTSFSVVCYLQFMHSFYKLFLCQRISKSSCYTNKLE